MKGCRPKKPGEADGSLERGVAGAADVGVAVRAVGVGVAAWSVDVDVAVRAVGVGVAAWSVDVDVAGAVAVDVAVGTAGIGVAVGAGGVAVAAGGAGVDVAAGTLAQAEAVSPAAAHAARFRKSRRLDFLAIDRSPTRTDSPGSPNSRCSRRACIPSVASTQTFVDLTGFPKPVRS